MILITIEVFLLISSCFSKRYSIILLNRLTEEANKRHLISVNQIGFQNEKIQQITYLFYNLQTLIDKVVKHEKRKLFVAFIDFRRAYDSINRNDLFFKLEQMEMRGLFLEFKIFLFFN